MDDKSYKDTRKEIVLRNTISKYVPNLKDSSFNDKCSSLKLTNNIPNDPIKTITIGSYTYKCTDVHLVFVGYDDTDYSDRTYTCIASASDVNVHPELKNFNDKLSSLQLFFAQKGSYECNDSTSHN